MLSSLLLTLAIEIEHAIEEDRQSEIIAEQRVSDLAAKAGEIDLVRIPPEGVSLDEIEKQAIVRALTMTRWHKKDAAELLQIPVITIHRRVMKFGLSSKCPKLARVG